MSEDTYIEENCPVCGHDVLHKRGPQSLVCSSCGAHITVENGQISKLEWHDKVGWHKAKPSEGWVFVARKEPAK